jgi:endonuclease/exonuclease/phosphatase family metal-dependent hydrolase
LNTKFVNSKLEKNSEEREKPMSVFSPEIKLKEAPAGQVLVINANLMECFPEDILPGYPHMRNFVKRLPMVIPYLPDVLLLQEVVEGSARSVAELLQEATGKAYQVAVCPEPTVRPKSNDPSKMQVRRDCAILIRSDAFKTVDNGGYFPSLISPEESAGDRRAAVKEHAYLLVEDKRGSTRLALISLHLLPGKFYRQDLIFRKKGQWTEEICEFQESQYTSDGQKMIRVIAGDFNNPRYSEEEIHPFWNALTGRYGYSDAVYDIGKPGEIADPDRKRIDYIFVKHGGIVDAASDLSYTKELQNDPNTFYSDHRMNWALLGTD